jgi:ABC-2 type transport system ATP-binding protein
MINAMLDAHTTVVWSTAYLDEAEALDHIILLNEGRAIFEGNPQEAIRSVSGRVFVFPNVYSQKRVFAAELLKKDGVMDSVILGQNVKVLINDRPISAIYSDMAASFIEVKNPEPIMPCFEDACIDILGGIKEKESPISEYIKIVSFNGEDNVIEAVNLTKKFGSFIAVDNISFSVKRGKIFGLLGPNGSGKSTTFKMLCGLIRQNSGQAKINGINIAEMGSEAKMSIGYMAQKFSLYAMLSVRQNLEFAAGAYRLSGKNKTAAVEKMIDIFNLSDLQNVNASQLSFGFKQRLALACAIMHKPPVLFLDEPTSGVDPITRKEFWLHVGAMVIHGVSIVITTHFMDEAENCDEIALIYKGKIRAIGTPDDLKNMCTTVENPTLNHAFIKIVQEVDT